MSVEVLRSLRTLAKKKKAIQQPLIAFADPVFEKSKTESAQLVSQGLVLQGLCRSGAIRGGLERLPQTREEARYIGKLLGAREKDLYLGIKASETNVKTLPLYDFKTLLFATHGLMAGEFRPGLQPALALSFVGDPNNDGLLELGESATRRPRYFRLPFVDNFHYSPNDRDIVLMITHMEPFHVHHNEAT